MTTQVRVSFPDEFLAQVDRIARQEQRSRSEMTSVIASRAFFARRSNLKRIRKTIFAYL